MMTLTKKVGKSGNSFNLFGKQTTFALFSSSSIDDDKGDNEKKKKDSASNKNSTAIVFVFAFTFFSVLSIAACICFLIDASAFIEYVHSIADIIKALCSVF